MHDFRHKIYFPLMKEVEKKCIFTQNRLNHLLCFSDAPLYHDKFNTDHATKIWNKQKITSFEILSTITTTLKVSGLNTSPVLRIVSNKRNGVIFLVIKRNLNFQSRFIKQLSRLCFSDSGYYYDDKKDAKKLDSGYY